MKRIITLLLAGLMIFSLTACGGATTAPKADEPASDEPATSSVDTNNAASSANAEKLSDEDYNTTMLEITKSYKELIGQLDVLAESYDNTDKWWEALEAVRAGSEKITLSVANDLTPYVPDSYSDAHASIVVAMAAYTDAIGKLQKAKDAKTNEERQSIIDEGAALEKAADELWASAVAE